MTNLIGTYECKADAKGRVMFSSALKKQLLPVVVPRVLEYLTFTEEDQRNIRQEMEVEYNPYAEEGDTGFDEGEEEDLTEKGFSGDTLRRLSFILARKIAINYAEDLWDHWGSLI